MKLSTSTLGRPHWRQGSSPPRQLIHGWGTLIQQEHDLQDSLERTPPMMTGPRSPDLDRIVDGQRQRIAHCVSLLNLRCQLLPRPRRFEALTRGRLRTPDQKSVSPEEGSLAALVAQHLRVLSGVEALSGLHLEPKGGDLKEVARAHEEMAWVLTALLREDDTAGTQSAPANDSAMSGAERDWENEGGLTRIDPSRER